MGIDDSFHLKLSKYFNLQKWKIYTINEIENVYSIVNQIFDKDLTIENNKLKLSPFNNLINQQFYLYKRQYNNKLNVEYPLRNLPKKLIRRQENITTVDIGYNIEYIDDYVKELSIKEISCEKKWINKFKMRYVTKIFLKEGSQKIHKNDFKDCISLLSIQLPKSLDFIEEGSFDNCIYCKDIKGDLKWYKFFHIEELRLETGIKVKREIFYNWKYLKNVYLPDSIESIEEGAFENSGIEEIMIPNKVTYIPDNAFKNCKNLTIVVLPLSIIDISPTAFAFCPKLKNIECKPEFRKYFNKKLIIKKNNIKWQDYLDYKSIEELEIPLDYEFFSEEDAILFFQNFPNLIKIKINPKYFKFINLFQITHIIIPNGVKNLSENLFENCIFLEYLEIPKINNFKINLNNCKNLSTLKIPDELYDYEMLKNCYKLRKIINFEGEVSPFNLKYKVKEGTEILNLNDLYEMKNLKYLLIPQSVKRIELIDKDITEHLTYVNCDPKWLQFLPIYQLKKVIIPEFVEIIDEESFTGGKEIDELFIQGNSFLCGKSNYDFEQIEVFNCFQSIGINASNSLKKSKKQIILNDGCKKIDKNIFKDWEGLIKIELPNSLEVIEERAFENCINLEEIEIPLSVNFVDITSFNGCTKLHTIRCRSEFFNCFQNKDNIKKINILEGSDYINPEMIKKFKNLEILELPNSIKKVEFDLSVFKNLIKIKCNEEVLKNLPKNSKKNFQEIEITSNNVNINRNILDGCINIQNVRINNAKINFEPPSHKTTIEDIINFDSENKKFEKYVRNILSDLELGNARNYPENNILDQIVVKMVKFA